jgi:high-affinity nickel permease
MAAAALLAAMTGVVQGARHALEPDHVTAVANVMVRAPSHRRGIFFAACWGLGHAAMLLAVAGPLVVLGLRLPESISTALELAVGVMLVGLGVQTLKRHRARRSPDEHVVTATASRGTALLQHGRRPFAIGVVHGLAGSGALAALVALTTPSAAAALACLALYALGTVVGMMGLAAAAGPLLGRVQAEKAKGVLASASGYVSLAVGAVWIVRTLQAI